jgi:hypothetical protein
MGHVRSVLQGYGLLPPRPVRLSLLAAACGFGCAVHPPHYAGEVRSQQASQSARPAWIDWGLTFRDGYVYIPGTASHTDRKKAMAAAEEQARKRLAAAVETRIMSDLRHDVTIDATRREGATKRVEERHAIDSRLRAVADVVIQGAAPEAEYWEEREVFGRGWEHQYDYWVLVKFPESEYYRQLENVRRTK